MDYTNEQLSEFVRKSHPTADILRIDPTFSPPDIRIDIDGYFQKIQKALDENIASELSRQSDILDEKISVELKRQPDSQEQIRDDLEIESKNRSLHDKKYFWLGVLFSAVIASSVQYLPMLIKFLQSLLLR